MDNQNTQPQPVDPTVVTMHTDTGSSKRAFIAVAVVFTAVTVALSLVIYMSSNNKPAAAAVIRTAPVARPSATPIRIPTVSPQDADSQELDSITVDDIEEDMSGLENDLNKL